MLFSFSFFLNFLKSLLATHYVLEFGRKEPGESRGFPILWMGIMKDVFQMEEKMQRPGKIENVKKKIRARAKKVL